MKKTDAHIVHESIQLLKKLIQVPSFSKKEKEAADLIEGFLKEKDIGMDRAITPSLNL